MKDPLSSFSQKTQAGRNITKGFELGYLNKNDLAKISCKLSRFSMVCHLATYNLKFNSEELKVRKFIIQSAINTLVSTVDDAVKGYLKGILLEKSKSYINEINKVWNIDGQKRGDARKGI